MDRRSGDRQTINQEFANLEQFRSEFASDISTTGCFIRSPRPLPVGTKVALKFTVIEGDLAIIEGTGEVVRSVRPPHAKAPPACAHPLQIENRAHGWAIGAGIGRAARFYSPMASC